MEVQCLPSPRPPDQTESEDEFHGLFDAFLEGHQPEGLHERNLVQDMAVARWRLRRHRLIGTGFFDMRLSASSRFAESDHGEDISDALRLAYVVRNDWSTTLSALSRYEARIERSFYRALHELHRPIRVHSRPFAAHALLFRNSRNCRAVGDSFFPRR